MKQKCTALIPVGGLFEHVWPSNESGFAAVPSITAVARAVRVCLMAPAQKVYLSNRASVAPPKQYPMRRIPLQMTMIIAAIALRTVGQTIVVGLQPLPICVL